MSRPFLVVPPTIDRWVVPRTVLDETRTLLASPGEEGCEAVVLWLGWVASPREARVTLAFPPRQIAYRTEAGLAVEIPVEEWTALALQLPPGAFVLAKVHTHAGEAYHSEVDAANPYLSHEGAVAITVPNFARDPLTDLTTCSVNVRRDRQWQELGEAEVREIFTIEEVAT